MRRGSDAEDVVRKNARFTQEIQQQFGRNTIDTVRKGTDKIHVQHGIAQSLPGKPRKEQDASRKQGDENAGKLSSAQRRKYPLFLCIGPQIFRNHNDSNPGGIKWKTESQTYLRRDSTTMHSNAQQVQVSGITSSNPMPSAHAASPTQEMPILW